MSEPVIESGAGMSEESYTVHWDDGTKPRFVTYADREDASALVADLSEAGRVAIILEDWA